MKRFHRIGGILLIALLLTGALAGAAGYWLLATESGARWAVDKGRTLAGVDLNYGTLNGTLWRGLRFGEVSLSVPGATLRLERIDGHWQLWNLLGGQLTIDRIALGPGDLVVEPGSGATPGGSSGNWPRLKPPLPVDLESLIVEKLEIRAGGSTWRLRRANLSARLGPRLLRIADLSLDAEQGETRYRAQLSGRLANAPPYGGRLRLQWSLTPETGAPWRGQARVRGDLHEVQLNHRLREPRHLATSGTLVPLAKPGGETEVPRFDLINEWQQLSLPGPEQTTLTTTGKLRIRGHPHDYHLEAETSLDTARQTGTPDSDKGQRQALLPDPLTISLVGEGDTNSLKLGRFFATGDDMSLSARGSLKWRDGLTWQTELVAANLDTARLYAPLPARVSGRATARGSLRDGDLHATFDVRELAGDLAGHQVAGSGRVILDPAGTSVEALELQVGANSLSAGGRLAGGQLAIQWQLQAPELNALADSLGGRLESSGSLEGHWPDLRVDMALSGDSLRLDAFRADQLELSLRPAESGGHRLAFKARDVAGNGWSDLDVSIDGSGTPQAHRLRVEASNPVASARLEVAGGYRQPDWQGTVERAQLQHPQLGDWQLRAPAPLSLAPDKQSLGRTCIDRRDTAVCAALAHSGEHWRGEADLRGLPLSVLEPWLPQNTRLEGRAHGSLKLSGRLPAPEGRFSLTTEDAALVLLAESGDSESEGEVSRREPLSLTLDGRIADRRLQADGQLRLPDSGELTLSGEWPLGGDGADPRGRVTGHFRHLDWVAGLVPGARQLQGRLDVDLSLAGGAEGIRPRGELRLEGVSVAIPAAGIELQKGSGQWRLDDDGTWQLSASAFSGEGQLRAEGRGTLNRDLVPTGEIRLQGERILLMDVTNRRAVVSPDLTLAFDDAGLALTGGITVPEGKLVIEQLSASATRVSPDEEIIGAEKPAATGGSAWRADIRVALGEEVEIRGFGVSGRLTGELRVRQSRGEATQATGTLRLLDGVYEAYGQSLTITRGHLLFRGPPDNPALNIVAEREVSTYRVGIEVGGYAQDIRSDIFSEPPLPPTEALTVLITGKPVDELNSSDANRVANAATALGISQSGWITSRLQNLFGVDVFTLEGGDDYLESSLVVGKYLSPRLFISYVQNLFTPENHVGLRYRLTDNLELKAESGESQSIDLLYQIDH